MRRRFPVLDLPEQSDEFDEGLLVAHRNALWQRLEGLYRKAQRRGLSAEELQECADVKHALEFQLGEVAKTLGGLLLDSLEWDCVGAPEVAVAAWSSLNERDREYIRDLFCSDSACAEDCLEF